MLKIRRIITDNAFCYENVELVDFEHEQLARGIKKFITQADLNQIILKTNDNKTRVITDWMVGVIEIRKMRPPKSDCLKVEKIVINGEISYGPCWLLEIEDYKRFGVPRVFEHQLSFVADRLLCICHQESLIEIVL